MGRITGTEELDRIPSKVAAMYEAVGEMIMEGLDVPEIKVSMITQRAGIGKGTAYEYFDTKEELVVCAIVYHMRRMSAEFEKAMARCHGFEEQLSSMLEQCGANDEEGQCFIRFVHVITNNSVFGRLVREKMNDLGVETPIVDVLSKIIRQGMERGEVRKDIPLDYAVCSLFGRLLTYTIYKCEPQVLQIKAPSMRQLIIRGILNELGVKEI